MPSFVSLSIPKKSFFALHGKLTALRSAFGDIGCHIQYVYRRNIAVGIGIAGLGIAIAYNSCLLDLALYGEVVSIGNGGVAVSIAAYNNDGAVEHLTLAAVSYYLTARAYKSCIGNSHILRVEHGYLALKLCSHVGRRGHRRIKGNVFFIEGVVGLIYQLKAAHNGKGGVAPNLYLTKSKTGSGRTGMNKVKADIRRINGLCKGKCKLIVTAVNGGGRRSIICDSGVAPVISAYANIAYYRITVEVTVVTVNDVYLIKICRTCKLKEHLRVALRQEEGSPFSIRGAGVTVSGKGAVVKLARHKAAALAGAVTVIFVAVIRCAAGIYVGAVLVLTAGEEISLSQGKAAVIVGVRLGVRLGRSAGVAVIIRINVGNVAVIEAAVAGYGALLPGRMACTGAVFIINELRVILSGPTFIIMEVLSLVELL